MKYEWNPSKAESNRAKHGVAFEEIYGFDWESAIGLVDDRREYGELRVSAFGIIGDRLYNLVYAVRYEQVRVISLRKANRREVKWYVEKA